jgi:hypothetical protein
MLLLGIQDITRAVYSMRKKYNIPPERIHRERVTLRDAALALKESGINIDPINFDPRVRTTNYTLLKK